MDRCDHCEQEQALKKCFDCELLYCIECVSIIHSKGKLQTHKIKDISCEKIDICQQCNKQNAELECEDCELSYCQACSDTFHRKGALKNHTLKRKSEKNIPSLKGAATWQDTKFGWYPNPKNEKCKYSNSILKNYFEQTVKFHADPEHFEKAFMHECNRQWDINGQFDSTKRSMEFIKGDNPNAVGALLESKILKPGDNKKLEFNISKLKNIDNVLDSLIKVIRDHEDDIHDSTGRTVLKPYFSVDHQFNVKMLTEFSRIQASVNETIMNCTTLELKYMELFGERSMRAGRSEDGLLKKKKSHNKRKAMKRKVQRLKDQCQFIAEKLCPSINLDIDQLNIYDANKVKAIVETSVREQTNYINVDFLNTIGVKHVKALFILIEKQLFTCEAKCIIMDNLCSVVETQYWSYFNSVYESGVNDENKDVEMNESESEEEKSGSDATESE